MTGKVNFNPLLATYARLQPDPITVARAVRLKPDVDLLGRPYHRMSQTVRTFLLMWLAFGGFMGAFFTFQYGPRIGVPSGLASGLLFAGFMSAFGLSQASKSKGQCLLMEGETLLKDGPANHFVRAEGVGGWLYLTNSRLYFRSHRFNIQNHELSIPLDQIVHVKTSLTLGIIPNGVTVETPTGVEKFVVQGARVWVEGIGQAKPAKA